MVLDTRCCLNLAEKARVPHKLEAKLCMLSSSPSENNREQKRPVVVAEDN